MAQSAQSAEIRIGELSRRTGCNIETIRYYERVGLLPHPSRSASRYRLYARGDIRRLTFVRRARGLGFTLDEVRVLLALSADQAEDTCTEVVTLPPAILLMSAQKLPIFGRWRGYSRTRCVGVMRARRPAVH